MAREETLAELTAGRMPQRYLRNAGTIGVAGQLRLLRAKVAVIGAGGLGGHVIELLARQGVGCLLVMDGDCFTRHNLNRQILATEENLGQNKAVAAAARVAAINPDVEVIAVPELLTSTNGSRWLAGSDVIVDALDSLNSRRILFQAAQTLAIPVVHGASFDFFGAHIPLVRLLAFVVAMITVYLLYLFMRKTKTGKGIQAVALDRIGAQAVGIDIQRMYLVNFALGSALAGGAGALWASIYSFSPHLVGAVVGKVFIVAILGGLGNIWGAAAGGILLGIAETAGVSFFGAEWQESLGMVIMVAVLLWRPYGLLGKKFFA